MTFSKIVLPKGILLGWVPLTDPELKTPALASWGHWFLNCVERLEWFWWFLGLYPRSLAPFIAGDFSVLALGFLACLGSGKVGKKSETDWADWCL